MLYPMLDAFPAMFRNINIIVCTTANDMRGISYLRYPHSLIQSPAAECQTFSNWIRRLGVMTGAIPSIRTLSQSGNNDLSSFLTESRSSEGPSDYYYEFLKYRFQQTYEYA